MIAAFALLLLAVAPQPPRLAAFGYERAWLAVNLDTAEVRRMDLSFAPGLVRTIGFSPNGKAVAFTSPAGASGSTKIDKLFFWSGVDNEPARPLTTTGHAESPVFSLDGAWILFGHHPDGAAMGTHQPDKYLQIYKIRTDGTGLSPLTASVGCHYAPQPTSKGAVFIHASCMGGTDSVQELSGNRESTWRSEPLKLLETAVTEDGLLVTSVTPEGAVVWRTRPNKKSNRLFEVPGAREIQLRAGKSPNEVFYRYGGSLMLWTPQGIRKIAEIERE
jgi:hypothetical protein